MRVVGGEFRSIPLASLPGDQTRPTADKVKESLFNVLGGTFAGGQCLDYYGGSGALAIEAVSRGMDHALICERSRPAQAIIEENLRKIHRPEAFTLLKGPNFRSLERWQRDHATSFDLVFLDPPYAQANFLRDLTYLEDLEVLADHALVVCEWNQRIDLQALEDSWEVLFERSYGSVNLVIVQRKGVLV